MKKVVVILLALVIMLTGCATGVSQDEYDELEEKYEELESSYKELEADYEEKNQKYNNLKTEYDALKEDYDEIGLAYIDAATGDKSGRFYLSSWIACELALGLIHDTIYAQDDYDLSAELERYIEVYELDDTEQAMLIAKMELILEEYE